MMLQEGHQKIMWHTSCVMLLVLICYLTHTVAVRAEQAQPQQSLGVRLSQEQQLSSCPLKPEINMDLCEAPTNIRVDNSESKQSLDKLNLSEGARCFVETHSGHMIVLTCRNGHWKQTDIDAADEALQSHRRKRFFGLLAWAVGALVVIGVSIWNALKPKVSYRRKPPNSQPTITCPKISSLHTPERGRTTVLVKWPTARATDKEDGTIKVTQTAGRRSGSFHDEGQYRVAYMAKDSGGKTASCSVSFSVKVLRCPIHYTSLLNGKASCRANNIYGSECKYSCNVGYKLQGRTSAVCQSTSTWSASKPVCVAISCGTPKAITHGNLCSGNIKKQYNYQSKCVVSCHSGYAVGQHQRDIIQCQANEQWSQPGECVDIEAPRIKCEDTKEVFAGPQLEPVSVQWTTPVTSDNSGLPVNVRNDPSSGTFFDPGQTKVTFTAIDAKNNVGTCSMMVIVNVKRCPHLSTPDHATVTCSHENAYGSECTFTCHQAYELEGNTSRTCQENETWAGIEPECKARSCVAPPTVSHGMYQCLNGHQYQESCSLTCDSGYTPVGPLTITCNINIQWSLSGYCLDTEAPIFSNGCPADMDVTAASLGEPTYVTYDLPDTTDNSGDVPTVVGKPVSGSAFDQGITTVTISGSDAEGNSASCEFVVSVRNVSCDEPNLDTTGKDLIAYDCEDSYVYGASCLLSCKDGNPLTGASTIKCDRDLNTTNLTWTWSGNVRPYCDSQACPKLDIPTNGALACDTLGIGGEICILMCNKNYMYPSSAPEQYTCFISTGNWLPHDSVPGCITRRRPGAALMRPSFSYFTDDCSSNSIEIKENFLRAIAASSFSQACTGNITCTISTVDVQCSTPTSSRKKRSTYKAEYQVTATIAISPYEDQESPSDTMRFYNNLMGEINNRLAFAASYGVFMMPEIGELDQYHYAVPEYECPVGTKIIYATMSCAGCGEGNTYDNTSNSCIPCPIGTYQDQEISFSCIECPNGTTTRDTRSKSVDQCLDQCQPGQFSSSGIQPCDLCPAGSYQSQVGMTSCSICPFGKSTLSSGASSELDCLFFNIQLNENSSGPIIQHFDPSPNTFSFSVWIKPVSASLFMTLNFELGLSLSANSETAFIGFEDFGVLVTAEHVLSKSSIRQWQHVAVVFNNGQMTLYVDGHYQNMVDNLQLENLTEATFTFTPSVNLTSVIASGFQLTASSLTEAEVVEMSHSCYKEVDTNLLAVETIDTKLISPTSCDDEDNCVGDPCGQHGTCVDGTGQFTCVCDKPWSGDTCQHAPDYCVGHECTKNATCINQPELGNYSCDCVSGFKGVLCDQTVVDGNWGSWQEWSICNVTCGSGQRSRVRECNNPSPDPEGQPCQGVEEELEVCTEAPCPVEGQWSAWSAWACDVTCGDGIARRTRSCDQPATNGGLGCQERSQTQTFIKPCLLSDCPVDGGFGEWNSWSPCSATCGGGVSTRRRDCSNPIPSKGGLACDSQLAREDKQCNTQTCPVCKQPELRAGHQSWNCSFDNTTDMHTCNIVCKSGMAIVPDHENNFECGHLTAYTWTQQTPDNPLGLLPECKDQQAPFSITPQFFYTYEVDCNKPPPLTTVEEQVTIQMEIVPCAIDGTCNYNVTAEYSCETRKRSAGLMKVTMSLENPDYSATAPRSLNSLTDEEQEVENMKVQNILDIAQQILNFSESVFDVNIDGVQYTGQMQSIMAFVTCEEGSGFYDGYCVKCPAGSYSTSNGTCDLCEKGFYQEQSGQSSCQECPDGTTTSGVGSYTSESCQADPPDYEDIFPLYLRFVGDDYDDDDDDINSVTSLTSTISRSASSTPKPDGHGGEESEDSDTYIYITVGVCIGVAIAVAAVVFIFIKCNRRRALKVTGRKMEGQEQEQEHSFPLIDCHPPTTPCKSVVA